MQLKGRRGGGIEGRERVGGVLIEWGEGVGGGEGIWARETYGAYFDITD